jgi:hypothetical protein
MDLLDLDAVFDAPNVGTDKVGYNKGESPDTRSGIVIMLVQLGLSADEALAIAKKCNPGLTLEDKKVLQAVHGFMVNLSGKYNDNYTSDVTNILKAVDAAKEKRETWKFLIPVVSFLSRFGNMTYDDGKLYVNGDLVAEFRHNNTIYRTHGALAAKGIRPEDNSDFDGNQHVGDGKYHPAYLATLSKAVSIPGVVDKPVRDLMTALNSLAVYFRRYFSVSEDTKVKEIEGYFNEGKYTEDTIQAFLTSPEYRAGVATVTRRAIDIVHLAMNTPDARKLEAIFDQLTMARGAAPHESKSPNPVFGHSGNPTVSKQLTALAPFIGALDPDSVNAAGVRDYLKEHSANVPAKFGSTLYVGIGEANMAYLAGLMCEPVDSRVRGNTKTGDFVNAVEANDMRYRELMSDIFSNNVDIYGNPAVKGSKRGGVNSVPQQIRMLVAVCCPRFAIKCFTRDALAIVDAVSEASHCYMISFTPGTRAHSSEIYLRFTLNPFQPKSDGFFREPSREEIANGVDPASYVRAMDGTGVVPPEFPLFEKKGDKYERVEPARERELRGDEGIPRARMLEHLNAVTRRAIGVSAVRLVLQATVVNEPQETAIKKFNALAKRHLNQGDQDKDLVRLFKGKTILPSRADTSGRARPESVPLTYVHTGPIRLARDINAIHVPVVIEDEE